MATKKKTTTKKDVDTKTITDDRSDLTARIEKLEGENYALRRSLAKANIRVRELARELKAAKAAPSA